MLEIDYVRLFVGRSGTTDVEIYERDRASDVLLVDIDVLGPQTASTIAAACRRVEVEIGMHRLTIVRCPEGGDAGQVDPAELRGELATRLRLPNPDLPIAVLAHQRLGQPILLDDGQLRDYVDGPGLAQIRDAEIRSLVEHYGAMASSNSLKYLLPSSTTSSSFLRLADVLRTRRDVEVLSLWIAAEIPSGFSSVTLATDTPGLLPLCLRLEAILSSRDTRVEQVIVTDAYPFGRGEADGVFPRVGPSDCIIYLLSVSRSGTFEDLITDALGAIPGRAQRILMVIGDMRGPASRLARLPSVRRVSLSSIGIPPEIPAADLEARPPVRVEASTFRLVPELSVAARSFIEPPQGVEAAFFQIAAETSAIGVECTPYSTSGSVRPRNRLLPFRVLLDELSTGVSSFLASHDEVAQSLIARVGDEGLRDRYDLAILPEADAMGGDGLARARSLIEELGVNVGEVRSVAALDGLEAKATVLVLLWGSVTGASVVRALQTVRSSIAPSQTDCLIVHFRPPSRAEGSVIERALGGGKLVALWSHIVPWSSPFASEARVLARWSADAFLFPPRWGDLVSSRLERIAPEGRNRAWEVRLSKPPDGLGERATDLFWSTGSTAEVAGRGQWGDSWYRHPPAVLLAAVAGLQSVRSEGGVRSDLRLDVADAVDRDVPRSWLAAVVRASQVGELWFGMRPNTQRDAAGFLCDWLEGSSGAGPALAELLAADAVGKIPTAASEVIGAFAIEQRESNDEVGLLIDLIRWARRNPVWPSDSRTVW